MATIKKELDNVAEGGENRREGAGGERPAQPAGSEATGGGGREERTSFYAFPRRTPRVANLLLRFGASCCPLDRAALVDADILTEIAETLAAMLDDVFTSLPKTREFSLPRMACDELSFLLYSLRDGSNDLRRLVQVSASVFVVRGSGIRAIRTGSALSLVGALDGKQEEVPEATEGLDSSPDGELAQPPSTERHEWQGRDQ